MGKFIGIILLIGAVLLILMLGKLPTINQNVSKPSETPTSPITNVKINKSIETPLTERVYIGSANPIILYSRLQKEETVNITGWKIKSNKSEIIIPQAVEIYDPSGFTPQSDIILKPNNYVEIYGLASPINKNFRLNKCIGYLQEIYKFEPPLYTNCPYFSSSEIKYLSGQCQNYIHSLGSCRTPDVNVYNSFPGTDEGNACRAFLQNIGYGSCFRTHQNNADFLSNEWIVWINQEKFLDSQHDYLWLYDKEGNLTSEYNY